MPNATTPLTSHGSNRRQSGSCCPSGLTTCTALRAAQARASWWPSRSFKWLHRSTASRREAATYSSKPKTRRYATTTLEIKTNGRPRHTGHTCCPHVGIYGLGQGRRRLLLRSMKDGLDGGEVRLQLANLSCRIRVPALSLGRLANNVWHLPTLMRLRLRGRG
jgi:hypothetical protein